MTMRFISCWFIMFILLFSPCFAHGAWYNLGDYQIRQEHPRLLITPETLTDSVERVADDSRQVHEFYRYLLDYADDEFDIAPGAGFYDYPENHMLTYALIYVLGEIPGIPLDAHTTEAYGRKAVDWLKVYADHFYTNPPRNDYAAGEVFHMSLAYDWVHSLLTPEDKAYILPRLFSAAFSMITLDAKTWFSDYTLGAFSGTVAGMATYGDDIGLDFSVQWEHYSDPAPFTFSGSSDQLSKQLIDTFISQYLNENYRMWNFATQGGGSFQSMTGHSGDLYMWVKILDAWQTASGQTQLSDFDYLAYWPRFWIYGMVPYFKNMSDTLSESGDGLVSTDNESFYSLFVPTTTMEATLACQRMTTLGGNYSQEAQLFQWMFANHVHRQYGYSILARIMMILWYDETVPQRSPLESGLPLTHYFGTRGSGDIHGQVEHPGGTGIVIMKSAWEDPDATLAVFKPRPFYLLHQDADSNSFIIYRKGYLAIDSGRYNNGDWSRHERNYSYRSIAHNTMKLFNPDERFKNSDDYANDGGQRLPGGPGRYIDNYTVGSTFDIGGLTQLESVQGKYDYAEGNATRAYNSTEYTETGTGAKVSLVKRKFIYLRSAAGDEDHFVVIDKVNATQADFKKGWLFHAKYRPQFKGNMDGGTAPNTYGGTPGTYYDGECFSVYDKGGRLFVNTLYPTAHTYKLVGGVDTQGNRNTDDSFEFYVNGTQYKTGIETYTYYDYRPYFGSWRVEVEPTVAQVYDLFVHLLSPKDIEGIIVDNQDPGFSAQGNWRSVQDGLEYYGKDFMAIQVGRQEYGSATFTPDLPEAGDYDVYTMWNDDDAYTCGNIAYAVHHSAGVAQRRIDHFTMDGRLAGDWYKLGTYHFDAGKTGFVTIKADESCVCGENNQVSADAIRFVKADTGVFQNNPRAQAVKSSEGDAAAGVFVTGETEKDKLVLSADQDTAIRATAFALPPTQTVDVLITDCQADTEYYVFSDGQTVQIDTQTIPQARSLKSSPEGTLFFDVQGNGQVDNPDDEGSDTPADSGHSDTGGGTGGCFILSLI